MEGASIESNIVPSDMRRTEGEALVVHPGGVPRVTDGEAAVETEVTNCPSDVMMNVTSVGARVTVGMAVALT